MRRVFAATVLVLALGGLVAAHSEGQPDAFPAFRVQDVDTGLPVCWNLVVADVNGDGKQDLIIAAPTHMVWCENPTWKPRTIVQGAVTKPNNNGFAATTAAGDGQLSIGLAGGWKPFDTKDGGTIVWLRRGKTLDQPWGVFPVAQEEPTPHRLRFADVLGEGKPQLILAPLMGRDSTLAGNWLDGRPNRVVAYRIPNDPAKDKWESVVVDQSQHVIHALTPVDRPDGKGSDLLLASYEGVHVIARDGSGRFTRKHLAAGNQENPKGHRGSSEVKLGKLKNGRRFLATIEPWHGHQAVVYTEPPGAVGRPLGDGGLWDRHVLDENLNLGHGAFCADLDGDGNDEIIIGVQLDVKDQPGYRRGVRLYKATDANGTQWVRHVLDDGGVAVEDVVAVDLAGSGRPDIVAVGKQSGKARIFWNQGRKK